MIVTYYYFLITDVRWRRREFFMWVYILVGTLCLLAGVALGFFIARKYMMNYLKKNPPINENMLRVMMMQMGQKPSQKKINQMMKAMQSQMDKQN